VPQIEVPLHGRDKEAVMNDTPPRIHEKPKKGHGSDNENKKTPPAGPHAKPHLIDKEKTPGAGALPSDTGKDGVDPGGG
jgi:hypothetical protein